MEQTTAHYIKFLIQLFVCFIGKGIKKTGFALGGLGLAYLLFITAQQAKAAFMPSNEILEQTTELFNLTSPVSIGTHTSNRSSRMDMIIIALLVVILVVILGAVLYWLFKPKRQQQAHKTCKAKSKKKPMEIKISITPTTTSTMASPGGVRSSKPTSALGSTGLQRRSSKKASSKAASPRSSIPAS